MQPIDRCIDRLPYCITRDGAPESEVIKAQLGSLNPDDLDRVAVALDKLCGRFPMGPHHLHWRLHGPCAVDTEEFYKAALPIVQNVNALAHLLYGWGTTPYSVEDLIQQLDTFDPTTYKGPFRKCLGHLFWTSKKDNVPTALSPRHIIPDSKVKREKCPICARYTEPATHAVFSDGKLVGIAPASHRRLDHFIRNEAERRCTERRCNLKRRHDEEEYDSDAAEEEEYDNIKESLDTNSGRAADLVFEYDHMARRKRQSKAREKAEASGRWIQSFVNRQKDPYIIFIAAKYGVLDPNVTDYMGRFLNQEIHKAEEAAKADTATRVPLQTDDEHEW
jgi:hypothetical protein